MYVSNYLPTYIKIVYMAGKGRKGCAGYEQQNTYIYILYTNYFLVNKLQCP